jgi:hypothetical protein
MANLIDVVRWPVHVRRGAWAHSAEAIIIRTLYDAFMGHPFHWQVR